MNGWYPQAVIRPGPVAKQYRGTNPNEGVVCHSMEGYRAGLYSVLDDPKRGAWTFSVFKDGLVEQHYPLSAVLPHSSDWGGDADGANGNGELVSIEHEGVVGEPLTPKQLAASVALVKWIAAQGRWVPSRTVNKTLWEHKELSDTGTACPSDRIPWSYYVIQEVPVTKPPKAPTAFYRPDRVAAFWSQAYANGAKPIRYDPDGKAVYEIRVKG